MPLILSDRIEAAWNDYLVFLIIERVEYTIYIYLTRFLYVDMHLVSMKWLSDSLFRERTT